MFNLSICADNHLVAEHNDEMAAVKKLDVFNPKKVFLTKIREMYVSIHVINVVYMAYAVIKKHGQTNIVYHLKWFIEQNTYTNITALVS